MRNVKAFIQEKIEAQKQKFKRWLARNSAEIVGWSGFTLLIIAYLFTLVDAYPLFYTLNFTASGLLTYYSFRKRAYPLLFVNGFITIITFLNVLRMIFGIGS